MRTILSKQERAWLLEQRVTRLTDAQEALIYPMGAERFLSLALAGDKPEAYTISADIIDKKVLIISGYANNAFLFAQAGAKSVTVYDKDPVTIAWVKAYKKYYHFRESLIYPSIGDLLAALTCWYPPLLKLPQGNLMNRLYWLINPKALRRVYIFYMLSLVQKALLMKDRINYELAHTIDFHTGELKELEANNPRPVFDTAYIPYLLGVNNGIEKEEEIVDFIKLLSKSVPNGAILVTPTQSLREFGAVGRKYFETTGRANIQSIPELKPFFKTEDNNWFKPQGLAVFRAKTEAIRRLG